MDEQIGDNLCVVELDDLDRRILTALAEDGRRSVLDLSRRLAVARNTVQARLDRMEARGILQGFVPVVDLAATGYPVLAFVTLEIAQGDFPGVLDLLRRTPEVIEVHQVTGQGDLLLRVAARTNEHLGAVLATILGAPGTGRTSTVLVLTTPLPARPLGLVAG